MKVTPVGRAFGKHKVGVHFELPDDAAGVLIHAGALKAVGRKAPAVKFATREGPRTYKRRDMRAET